MIQWCFLFHANCLFLRKEMGENVEKIVTDLIFGRLSPIKEDVLNGKIGQYSNTADQGR